MKYNIRVILESKEDVIRDIEINSDCLLSELHHFLIECFELNKLSTKVIKHDIFFINPKIQ